MNEKNRNHQLLSPYLERLEAVKEYFLWRENEKIDSPRLRHQHMPQIAFLDHEQGVARAAAAIAEGHPVVTDYGATFGTAFSTSIREEVALARGEKVPLEVVSVVATQRQVYEWLDETKLPPELGQLIQAGQLGILEGVAFVRFPANDRAKQLVSSYCINAKGEIQVFMVPESDPLMRCLRDQYNISHIAVRSSNITGLPEEPYVDGAMKYASQIGAPLFIVRKLASFKAQVKKGYEIDRPRVGSQPIVRLPMLSEERRIEVVRTGNTSFDTLKRLMAEFTTAGFKIVDKPEKIVPFSRKTYQVDPSITDPHQIKIELLRASDLL